MSLSFSLRNLKNAGAGEVRAGLMHRVVRKTHILSAAFRVRCRTAGVGDRLVHCAAGDHSPDAREDVVQCGAGGEWVEQLGDGRAGGGRKRGVSVDMRDSLGAG